MIKLNDRFEFERTKYNWELHEWRDGKDRDGQHKRHKQTTYYPNIKTLCGEIIDRSIGRCETLEQIIDMLSGANKMLADHVEDASYANQAYAGFKPEDKNGTTVYLNYISTHNKIKT